MHIPPNVMLCIELLIGLPTAGNSVGVKEFGQGIWWESGNLCGGLVVGVGELVGASHQIPRWSP